MNIPTFSWDPWTQPPRGAAPPVLSSVLTVFIFRTPAAYQSPFSRRMTSSKAPTVFPTQCLVFDKKETYQAYQEIGQWEKPTKLGHK